MRMSACLSARAPRRLHVDLPACIRAFCAPAGHMRPGAYWCFVSLHCLLVCLLALPAGGSHATRIVFLCARAPYFLRGGGAHATRCFLLFRNLALPTCLLASFTCPAAGRMRPGLSWCVHLLPSFLRSSGSHATRRFLYCFACLRCLPACLLYLQSGGSHATQIVFLCARDPCFLHGSGSHATR